ncbi:ELMO/CED-12 family-domain-containing protein [Lentinula lateritia]|uniref:ELMO/CED-12 family-domain-containing protein n=1 Tax=Lentinula aff. lateritia TaxID=2804960 RepID=A0ACC1TLU0_9AGAR|nr:ELMO/CED-12 family-domain-containing protein [Lentinula aff. lateritia]KAJ3848166.1 ELMO/CED-12 family-domain-containing protein [Lentinula lateritia]
MSNHNSLPPRSPLSSTPPTNGSQAKSGLVPTNNVTTGEGITVRARIDPTLTVADVVRQLCVNLKIKGMPSDYALRDENHELVTNDNLRKKIKARLDLKLVNSPNKEGREIAEKLQVRDQKTMRLTLYTLQRYIRENEFASEFINYDGVTQLVDIIFTSLGNTLAYALTAMQNLMELDHGWASFDEAFIFRVVQVLSSPHSLINVCRPATAILKKLVEADPSNAPGPQAGTSKNGPAIVPGSIYRYGFTMVFEQMRKEKSLLETIVNRLGSADTAMAQYSMMLINSLLSHASDARWEEFIAEMERFSLRKAVVRLMSQHTVEELTSCILDFQANMLRVTYRKKSTLVDLDAQLSHVADLNYIWDYSKLIEESDEKGQQLKWRKLGFDTEDVESEFNDVGVLGLECLKRFVERDPDFSKVVLEQLSRPAERRCPIAKASNEVVELLSEHWAIFAPGYSTSTTFQPLFLDFYKVHALATNFFIRMWSESGAATGDFIRVVALVRSQVKVALRNENVRAWHEVEHDFLECEYRAVRDRQMKELEQEDDLLSKIPVRNLRAKIFKESYEFVRQQRIQCLLQGAWFVIALPGNAPQPRDSRRPSKPWRFVRLDNSTKYLHYVDSAVKFPVRSGLEDLPDRIEIAAVSEIATGTCAPPPNVLRDHDDLPPTTPLAPSPLSFSLLSIHEEEGSLVDLIAPDQSRWADWTDGLNMLRKDGGHVASKETAGFVQALTEIGLKIKLLDLSGEMVEIPSGLTAGPPPPNTDFFFSELI